MKSTEEMGEQDYVFNFQELEAKREVAKRAYLPFLNVDTLHCGIYSLPKDTKDEQTPHTEDEIYYVESGRASINIKGVDYDVQPGSIVFVPAHAPHHFHSIKVDLRTLVLFSKAPVKHAENKPAEKIDSKQREPKK